MPETTIDLGTAPEQERLERLVSAFGALSAGGIQVFLSDSDPRALISPFIASHWGQFDWAPLKEGGTEWIFQIRKREREGSGGLLDMLADEHSRCDELFAQAESAAQEGDLPRTEEIFGRLELGLERHFRMEEEGFFGEVERGMGFMGGGPTAVMRDEHQQMRGMLRRMAGTLADGNLDDYMATGETMLFLMEQHNMKEEQMLYPMAEDVLGAGMEELLKRLTLF